MSDRPDRSDRTDRADRAERIAAEITPETLSLASAVLEQLVALSGLELEGSVTEGEGRVEIELSGSDQEAVLRNDGQVLLAIQELFPRLLRGMTGVMIPCRLDSGGFHAQREQRLQDVARTAAQSALDSGQPQVLQPMPPDERRIVHLSLAEEPGVATESQGQGWLKRVSVIPAQVR